MIRVPTPLEQLHHPLLEEKEVTLFVKRDDLTHPDVMGNKWRKLKYNLEEAKRQGKTRLVTMGGAFSNHIAATAAAGYEFGFETVGIIRGEELTLGSNDTLKFASQKGMNLQFVSREIFRQWRETPTEILATYPDAYFLPEGGTNQFAIEGVKEVIGEIEQDFDMIITAMGTAGTFCGLAAALSPSQSILGISALKGHFMVEEAKKLLEQFDISHQNYEVNTGYHFGGYGKTTDELIVFINWFKENFGIPLDPIYTGKCFFGVWDMLKNDKFDKSQKIVLLHTGGLQGIRGFNRKIALIVQ